MENDKNIYIHICRFKSLHFSQYLDPISPLGTQASLIPSLILSLYSTSPPLNPIDIKIPIKPRRDLPRDILDLIPDLPSESASLRDAEDLVMHDGEEELVGYRVGGWDSCSVI